MKEKIKIYDDGKTNYIVKCPCCNSTDLITHGYYERTIIYECDKKIVSEVIIIKRIKCKSCNKTHALIPIDIIPYKQVIFKIIIDCIYDEEYYNKTMFSFEVRQKWIRQYRYFFPYIRSMLETNIYEKIKENYDEFYNQFYIVTRKIILLIRKCNYNIGIL